jgi:hypothetical protein
MARKAGKPFSALQGAARQHALEWGRSALNDCFDSDEMTRDLQGYAKETHGLSADKCFWSLRHCQGDGVAFYGTIDIAALADKHEDLQAVLTAFSMACPHVTLCVSVKGEHGHYHHWNSMEPVVDVYDYSKKEEDAAEATAVWIQDYLADLLKEISRDVERYGYSLIDDQNSDEYIADFLEANEYRFTRAGDFLQ